MPVSLDAELKRREHVLARCRAKDITAYQEIADRLDLPALPRLVLVVDDSPALVNELPDFIRGPSTSRNEAGRSAFTSSLLRSVPAVS